MSSAEVEVVVHGIVGVFAIQTLGPFVLTSTSSVVDGNTHEIWLPGLGIRQANAMRVHNERIVAAFDC